MRTVIRPEDSRGGSGSGQCIRLRVSRLGRRRWVRVNVGIWVAVGVGVRVDVETDADVASGLGGATTKSPGGAVDSGVPSPHASTPRIAMNASPLL